MMSDKLPADVTPDEEVQADEPTVSETELEAETEEQENTEPEPQEEVSETAEPEPEEANADETVSEEAEPEEEVAAEESEPEPEVALASEEAEDEEESEPETVSEELEESEPEPETVSEELEEDEGEPEAELDEEPETETVSEDLEEDNPDDEDDDDLVAVAADTEDAEEDEEPEEPNNKLWYIVKVQSGREDTIRDAIERRVKIDGLEEYFGQIFIPTEQRTDLRRGKTYTRTVKKLPGYIMAEVEFNDRMLYLFRETPGVGDFVRGHADHKPPPMTPEEVSRWIGKGGQQPVPDGDQVQVQQVTPKDAPVSEGDRVRVRTGMFDGMEGEVLEVLHDKNLLRVELQIFGRPVSTELEYHNIEPL